MILSHGKCRKLLAVLLSASFIWATMACVSLCLLHCSEEEQCSTELSDKSGKSISFENQSAQVDELVYTDSDSCCQTDCCPMKPLPVCTLQKSPSFDFQAYGDYQVLLVHSIISANSTLTNNAQYLIPCSSSDPPLKRLCTLRI
jgi:hypothetical protein